MVKFYIQDLTLVKEVDTSKISTEYSPLEYSGHDTTLKKLKDWTLVFNLPLTYSTVSAIELLRSFVKEVIVTCTEESMIDHSLAAYLASKNVSIITPYGTDFRKNVDLLKEVVGFGADIIIDSSFKYSGFSIALSPEEFSNSTYAILECESNHRPPYLASATKAPSMHLVSKIAMNTDPKHWRSELLDALCYYVYWCNSKWEAKPYRWLDFDDSWS